MTFEDTRTLGVRDKLDLIALPQDDDGRIQAVGRRILGTVLPGNHDYERLHDGKAANPNALYRRTLRNTLPAIALAATVVVPAAGVGVEAAVVPVTEAVSRGLTATHRLNRSFTEIAEIGGFGHEPDGSDDGLATIDMFTRMAEGLYPDDSCVTIHVRLDERAAC